MNVAELVAHVALTGLWYSIDLSARGADLAAVRPAVSADAGNGELIETTSTLVNMLATVVAASPPDARGFHPFGQANPSGFAAMACDEMLVHGYDIAIALGVDFRPPPTLVEPVLTRLFPWTPESGEAWPRLLWANGRATLAEHPRLTQWRWHCAPLDECNGDQPS